MEKAELTELVRNFDDFVQLSLQKKVSIEAAPTGQENTVENYMINMERRLKLNPPSQEARFEKLLKPMKDLKSFVSVREFMQKLGTGVKIRREEKSKTARQEERIKAEYETLRGGFYLQRIEDHLKRKQFKRHALNSSYFLTELQGNPLEQTEYRSWIEATLGKISPKNDTFFRQSVKPQPQDDELAMRAVEEADCLIEEHKKTYAEQFKVVPHIRQLCHQEYEDFTKISSLLTGRLRKLLKSNCSSRPSVCGQPQKAFMETPTQPTNTHTTSRFPRKTNIKSTRMQSAVKPDGKLKRVQTAGNLHRNELSTWKKGINNKMKHILGQSDQMKTQSSLIIDDLQ